jgi:uncharacterized membrane protein YgaE (UPF0421/DUF939 family)
MNNILDRIKKINYAKIIRIVIGSSIALYIAKVLDLKYYTAAGVISILTIYDTKKETLNKALKRVTSFIISLIIAYLVFLLFGYEIYSFAIFLLLFISVSYLLKLNDHIVVNSVLITHLLVEKSIGIDILINESLLMLVGGLSGVIMNLFINDNSKLIREDQLYIENKMKEILTYIATYLYHNEGEVTKPLEELKAYIVKAIARANENSENRLLSDSKYYYTYMLMRKNQISILENINHNLKQLTESLPQSKLMGDYLIEMSKSFHEHNNAVELLNQLENLKEKYKVDVLPTSRSEFENRAILFQILNSLERFLVVKRDFVLSLKIEEIETYWKK